jgi:hypothetical protein
MSVTDAGTPSLQTATGTGSPKTLAGAWGTGQTRAANNLLVALVTATGSTSASAITENTSLGWVKIFEGAGSTARAAIFTKIATGGNSAPTFQSTLAGTSSHSEISVELHELNDSTGNIPELDVGNAVSSSGSGTLSVTTVGNVSGSGELALAVQSLISASSTTNTWGAVGSWTQIDTDAATAFSHFVNAIQAGPSSGSTLVYNPTQSATASGRAAAIAVFKPGRSTTPMTVTATPTGAVGVLLRVHVLTNALTSGGNTKTQSGASSVSFTPNNSKSLILWAVDDFFSNTTFTAFDANNTVVDTFAGSGTRFGSGKYISTVTAATPITTGVANVDGGSAYLSAVQEILSADGSNTPVIDPSGPPAANSGSGSAAKNTSLFAPPPGAVLVAVLSSGGTGTSAWTISDSIGLTWTKLADDTVNRFYIAQMPSAAASSVAMHKMGLSGAGVETDSGTGSVQMHKMGLAASGKEIETGTGSVRMHKMGLSAAGKEIEAGTGSVRMHKMGLAASGKETETGTGSVRMHKMGLAASGKETETGTGSVRMHKMGLAGSGGIGASPQGPGSVRMHKVGLSGSGKETDAGSGSVRMHKMGLSAAGKEIEAGSGSVRMHKMGLSAAGKEIEAGTGSVRMHKMGLAGIGKEKDAGTGSVRMHKMGLAASGKETETGTGSVRMHKMGLSGSGRETTSGPIAVSMHKMGLSGSGGSSITHGVGSVRMHKMSLHGSGDTASRPSNLFIFTAV